MQLLKKKSMCLIRTKLPARGADCSVTPLHALTVEYQLAFKKLYVVSANYKKFAVFEYINLIKTDYTFADKGVASWFAGAATSAARTELLENTVSPGSVMDAFFKVVTLALFGTYPVSVDDLRNIPSMKQYFINMAALQGKEWPAKPNPFVSLCLYYTMPCGSVRNLSLGNSVNRAVRRFSAVG